jgi:hypothetical protein
MRRNHELKAQETDIKLITTLTLQRKSATVLLALALGAALFTVAAAAAAKAAQTSACTCSSQLPNDCAGAVNTRFANLRNYRYCEVDLFGEDNTKKVLYNNSYNTTGHNGGDHTRDSCPQALCDTLDADAIKKEYNALFVFLNPPRSWTVDWATDYVGTVRDFNGLQAPWMGHNAVSKGMDFSKGSSRAYHHIPVARKSAEGFNQGSTVVLLDDPQGRTWIMTSYTTKHIPDMTIDTLETLGSVITLPPGWTCRTTVLEKDLVLLPTSGVAGVTQDDKENTYDLTGPGQSNLKP